MKRLNLDAEKEEWKKEAIERHARLHRLFVEDRMAFERERKRLIDDFINNVEDKGKRERLRALQKSWDIKMKHAGSEHNRFVLAQTIFWDHFYEKWYPAIQQFNLVLNSKLGKMDRIESEKKLHLIIDREDLPR